MPTELIQGLIVGLLALAAVHIARHRWDWGLLWAVAAIVALSLVRPRSATAIDGLLSPLVWLTVLVISAASAWHFGKQGPFTPLIFLVSLGGAWATVPDTESISVLLGVAFPLAVLPYRRFVFSWWGGAGAGTLTAIIVASEGGRRTAAVVGAAGALAVAAVPAGRRWRRNWPLVGLLLRQVLLVGSWSRIAGRMPTAVEALQVGVALSVIVLVAELWWDRLSRRVAPESDQ